MGKREHNMVEWLIENWSGILVGLVSSVIFQLIILFISSIINKFKVGISKFSGEWEQLIFSNNSYEGDPIKKDVYKLKHTKIRYSGELSINMKGSIIRTFPINDNKKWKFIGYLDGDILTILYQSEEGQKSRGCIYVKLYKDYEFRGYYLEEHRDGKIDKTPLIIRKRG